MTQTALAGSKPEMELGLPDGQMTMTRTTRNADESDLWK
jgi:hypothetical protein